MKDWKSIPGKAGAAGVSSAVSADRLARFAAFPIRLNRVSKNFFTNSGISSAGGGVGVPVTSGFGVVVAACMPGMNLRQSCCGI